MPFRNICWFLFILACSLFIASKTSLKEQIVREVARQLEKQSLEPPTKKALFEGALSGLARAVDDQPYTAYLPPREQKDYMREIQGQYAGVGLSRFVKDEASKEFYFVPEHGAPANKAGLKLGERIVAVDDKDVAPLTVYELTEAIRGEEGKSVKLKVRAASFDPSVEAPVRDVEIVRGVLQQDSVSGDRLDKDGNWIYALQDVPEIGYVAIEQFVDSTGARTIEALSKLEKSGVTKVVLDFRGNPGGFLPDAVAVCNEFLSYGSPIVETRFKNGKSENFVARKYPRKRFSVAVLIDEESASASEIVSAALQDAGVAVVVGTRSYGKGTIQSIYELPFKSGLLRMTTASFWRPSGAPIRRLRDATEEDEWGVKPDEGYEVRVSSVQRFYSQWIRRARLAEPEGGALTPQFFSLATNYANDALKRLREGSNFDKIEVAAELGVELNPELLGVAPSESKEDDSKSEEKFVPLGRAPYFDPQLDRAIDYLRSIEK